MKFSPRFRSKITYIFSAVLFLLIILHSDSALCRNSNTFLWKVQSPENTVFILGSIHLLNKDSYPLAEQFEKAYQESSTVIFETDIDQMESPRAQELIKDHALLPPGRSIRELISNSTYQLLAERLSSTGVDFDRIERLKPWMCALTLTVVELYKLGFDPQYGIDRYFFGKAKKDTKRTAALETVEEQIRILSYLDSAKQESFLKKTLKELDITEKYFNEMILAWNRGDAEKIYSMTKKGFEGYPDIFKKFFRDRNLKWVSQIEKQLNQNENALIIVGAGHLPGPEGVINLLARKGYKISQQ